MLFLSSEDNGYQRDYSENLAFAYAVSHQPFVFKEFVLMNSIDTPMLCVGFRNWDQLF